MGLIFLYNRSLLQFPPFVPSSHLPIAIRAWLDVRSHVWARAIIAGFLCERRRRHRTFEPGLQSSRPHGSPAIGKTFKTAQATSQLCRHRCGELVVAAAHDPVLFVYMSDGWRVLACDFFQGQAVGVAGRRPARCRHEFHLHCVVFCTDTGDGPGVDMLIFPPRPLLKD